MTVNYAPGETVPQAGVYAVLHGKPHDYYHQLYVPRGNFPLCRVCSTVVRFRLIRPVMPIEKYEDFQLGAQAA
jgi:hypothetical protein